MTAADRRPLPSRLAASLRRHLAQAETGVNETLVLCNAMAVLLGEHLRFDAADPLWPDGDRLVLARSVGALGDAASALLRAPPGLFHSSAQPLGVAVGLAMAERILAGRFGRSLVDHRCWVLGGDAALATGPVQEAACLAGQWHLGRLAMIVGLDGDAPGVAGFAAHGWTVRRVDAGAPADIDAALSAAQRSFKPNLIVCVGAAPPALQQSGPQDDGAWTNAARHKAGVRRAWLKRLNRHAARQEFDAVMAGRLPGGWHTPLNEPGWPSPPARPDLSTAGVVRQALADMAPGLPSLAALPGEPGWRLPAAQAEPAERHRGCRLAGGTAAALTGLAQHGGTIPYAVHGLEALDHLRPALDDAARAGLRLLHVLIEPACAGIVHGRRAALRAMRNVVLFRPADASEALECLELALRRMAGPSVILVSEHPCTLLVDRPTRTRSAHGGHVVAEATPGPRAATLIASGPELHLALGARVILGEAGVAAAVVSLPSWTVFAAQEPARRAMVLGEAPRFGVEAGSGFGWERWLGDRGHFVDLSAVMQADGPGSSAGARHLAEVVMRRLRRPAG